MELVLVRHGESDGNANGLCQGNSPGYLTAKGLSQASSLRLFTKGEYDAIYSSDLTRVVQTAQSSISDAKLLNSVIYDSLLREKHAGIFEMKKRELMVTARTTSGLNERLYQPQDGESWQQLQDRVRLFYDKMKETYKGRSVRILVYTSGGWIKEFVNYFVYQNQQLYPNIARNAHIYVFRRKLDADEEFEMLLENQRTL